MAEVKSRITVNVENHAEDIGHQDLLRRGVITEHKLVWFPTPVAGKILASIGANEEDWRTKNVGFRIGSVFGEPDKSLLEVFMYEPGHGSKGAQRTIDSYYTDLVIAKIFSRIESNVLDVEVSGNRLVPDLMKELRKAKPKPTPPPKPG